MRINHLAKARPYKVATISEKKEEGKNMEREKETNDTHVKWHFGMELLLFHMTTEVSQCPTMIRKRNISKKLAAV